MTNYVNCMKVTDEELSGPRLAAEGEASFEIIGIEVAKSQAGNPKVIIKYSVRDSNGKPAHITEHLPMQVSWRVARVASVTGTSEEAKAGNIDVDKWLHKKGRGVIKHDLNDKGNKVAVWQYFIKPQQQTGLNFGAINPEVPASVADNNFDDSIPWN